MSSSIRPLDQPAPTPGARQLSRGVTATWWYTASAVVFLELMLLLAWTGVAAADAATPAVLVVGTGGLLWCASSVLLLIDYRHRLDAAPGVPWARLALPMLVAVAFGITAGTVIGSWQLTAMPVLQSVALLNWPRGVRLRVVIAATLVLVCLGVVDSASAVAADDLPWWLPSFYTAMLPVMSVSSLWWWDVLITLDRARASEARLAATQERLRVATDVHDLQGHHLQVIALQLELAERLMPRDAAAGMEQLRAARASVDEARQGTRDLATRFRSVPLRDEIANARDLLTAAGLEVDIAVPADADDAPASDLGPVIRETTTNILRHGGGRRARLTLSRTADAWRYEVSNDAAPGVERDRDGAGLDGIARRIAEAGGALDVQSEGEDFVVIVSVPAKSEVVR